MAEPRKILLGEDELPSAWFNIVPSMPTKPDPYLHPQTRQPVGPDDLAPLFPMALIGQEVSTDEWVDIPGPVLDTYKLWRPTPLIRALDLERALGTPARIYYKYEGGSPAGSHKPNTAVPQAFYNKAEGITRISTETGAGQWGSAMAFACARFDLECKVYMVRASYDGKPYRRSLMETWGASVIPSPSPETNAGRAVLDKDPDSPGSLGIAISEAVEDAATREDTHYALGSVLNHVLLHQTVIGLELKAQLEQAGVEPDVLVACVGGGSNFGGFTFPLLAEKLAGRRTTRVVAVEPTAAPTLTEGRFEYDLGDQAGMTPLMPDVHPRRRLHPGPDPRRRAALPRRLAAGVAAAQGGPHRGRRLPAVQDLRGGGAVRPHRGHPPGPRAGPRHPGRDRRGPALQGGRQRRDDRLQPLRPRPLRPQGLRGLPVGDPP